VQRSLVTVRFVLESSGHAALREETGTYFDFGLLTYLLTYLLTHSLTPWSSIFFQKLIVTQLYKE
jgi:hypothetical protein